MKAHAIAGIHHITAISGPAAANVAFYRELLGLRLVKRTVNFDDPGTYHLYYGNRAGQPGTIMTFFPWSSAPGRAGAGTGTVTAFEVPAGSLGYWVDRLQTIGSDFQVPRRRFEDMVFGVRDADGLRIEIAACARTTEGDLWVDGSVPADQAIRGFRGFTLPVPRPEDCVSFLTETLGFIEAGLDGDRLRVRTAEGGIGDVVDVVPLDSSSRGWMGTGIVHHVAFRAADEADQQVWSERLRDAGLSVTPVQDRQYFRSIYFRHPVHTGGILFEIATDGPGFALDEPIDSLGEALKLPVWLESRRAAIEAALPSLETGAPSP